MYNRYIPAEDGTYHRQRVENAYTDVPNTTSPSEPPCSECRPLPQPSSRFDADELLVIILLLLLLDDQEDDLSLLIAALAFLML